MFLDPTHIVTWKRATAVIVTEATVASTMTLARQPGRGSRVRVRLTGSPTGTVTVSGTSGGGVATEVLTWTGTAGFRETLREFTAITSITTSLSGGTKLEATAVGTDGSPQITSYTIKTGHPIAVHPNGDPRWRGRTQGAEEAGIDTILVWFEEVWTPRVGDRVIGTGLDAWEILSVSGPLGGLRQTHYECVGVKLPDTDPA
jgi:hypothetical protein